MEELLAYAYLLGMDLISEEIYEEKLNELFLQNPTDEDLLDLEFLNRNRKETIIYIQTHLNYNSMDFDKFGRVLFGLLKPIYASMDIRRFGNAMYSLWEKLPGNLQDMQPFLILCYADDPLSWGDEKQSREIYEEMLEYYEADSLYEMDNKSLAPK
ncbi:MAG: hypothetical protein IJA10_09315 [Lachnospiraceae bacterium]|nr:hypothetical protein [Lachnospiraceae bacterium]